MTRDGARGRPAGGRGARPPAPHAAHRLGAAAGAAALAWLLARTRAPDGTGPLFATLVAYVIGAATYVGLTGIVLGSATAQGLARRAAAEDPGRAAAFFVVLTSSATVVGGALALLRGVPHGHAARASLLGLTLGATVLAWVATNTVFALHYAHLHFGRAASPAAVAPGESTPAESGFMFAGRRAPDGLDFVYLAFTVGMTFQVSDVQVATSSCRRAVLRHALLAFAYNTVLVAFVINMLFGQLQQGRV